MAELTNILRYLDEGGNALLKIQDLYRRWKQGTIEAGIPLTTTMKKELLASAKVEAGKLMDAATDIRNALA